MKVSHFSRRSILGFASMLGSSLAFAGPSKSLQSLLLESSGEVKVRAILRKHFGLDSSHDKLVRSFYTSLLTSEKHSERPEFFMEQLKGRELQDRLERYVLEEFVVCTNYFVLSEGDKSELKLV